MKNQQQSVLNAYHQYTQTFQQAYEAFVAGAALDVKAKPDTSTALPFYNEPCMFVYSHGIELYKNHEQLAAYFEQVMAHMKASSNLRSELGVPRLTFLGASCVLLSVEVVRVNRQGEQYEESGATYTMHLDKGLWKIAVVAVHPRDDVFGEPVI